MSAQDDRIAAAALEQAGDDAVATGSPARALYLDAQKLLMPAGARWTDADEYRIHMDAFERLQQKIYQLGPELRAPAPADCIAPDPGASGMAAPAGKPLPDAPDWQVAAMQGRLQEAAALLLPAIRSEAGMGGHLTLGRASETRAEELAADGHVENAALLYAKALQSYLAYALIPGRGDHEDEGYGRAARVVGKMRRLASPGSD